MVVDECNTNAFVHAGRMPGAAMNMRRLNRGPATDPSLLLLRSACHELRPPMATLSSLVNAMSAPAADAHRDELIQLAAEHASHARAVLDQVAAAAHGLAGPDDGPLPLHRVLPSVAAVVPADRLALSVTGAAGRCLVRPRHLRQVLINLLTNADRHAPSGSTIRLSGRTRWNRLQLTVADQGAPTAGLTRALRRTTPPADDNGLGLWLVRHLVTAQGGTLRARALVPYGLAMELSLPRRVR
jgi:signal transduction histidine kinase